MTDSPAKTTSTTNTDRNTMRKITNEELHRLSPEEFAEAEIRLN